MAKEKKQFKINLEGLGKISLEGLGKFTQLLHAAEVAKEAHEGQFRKTRKAYITHPIAVAKIAEKYGADEPTIEACLLHDVVEDTRVGLGDIEYLFDLEVSSLVDGVIKEKTREATHEKFKKYASLDKRVVLIKLADRLHNMQTMDKNKMPKTFDRYIAENPFYISLGKKYGFRELADKLEEITNRLK